MEQGTENLTENQFQRTSEHSTRSNISNEQRKKRRERQRRAYNRRTEDQTQRVRARSRLYARQRWLNMSDDQRQRRRERQRHPNHQRTEEEIERAREHSRIYERQRWLNMSDEQRERRRERQRLAYHQRRLSTITMERERHRENGDSQIDHQTAGNSTASGFGVMGNNVPEDDDHSIQTVNVNDESIGNSRDQSVHDSSKPMRLSHIRQLARHARNHPIADLRRLIIHESNGNTKLCQEPQGNMKLVSGETMR